MKAQTFIFVHDQYIVLDYLAAGKFNELPDVKYVFLGQRPSDQIGHLVDMGKVIIARDLPDNIEHYPNLVAWTGWYAIARNGLITADIVNLFEYDVNVTEDWSQPTTSSAYFWHQFADSVWWNYNGIRDELRRMKVYVGNDPLPMTSNYTLKTQRLKIFVDGLMNASNINAEHPQAGHIIERYCSSMFHYEVNFADGLQHLYADSHGTQGRGDRYEQLKSKLL
jgi:hypothetical protein